MVRKENGLVTKLDCVTSMKHLILNHSISIAHTRNLAE